MIGKISNKEFQKNSYLFDENASYLEELYESFLKDPSSVSSEMQSYFSSLSAVNGKKANDLKHQEIQKLFREQALAKKISVAVPQASLAPSLKQEQVDSLIEAYRKWGHIEADLDPLKQVENYDERLTLAYHHLSEADNKEIFFARGLFEDDFESLDNIYRTLRAVYCGTLTLEFDYISDPEERRWLKEYFEKKLPASSFSKETQQKILKSLIAAEGLEKYLGKKYVGQKRFSLEGGDSFIPLLQGLIEKSSQHEIREIVIAMAHRGRLNVLVNVMGKPTQQVFEGFEGKYANPPTVSGDVKYHLGYSSDVQVHGNDVHLSVPFNPSHLESVCPVAMGSVRARQDCHPENKEDYALGIIVHGDSAFSGQGVVMETLNMANTRGFGIGGSIHIIINNQVGFTAARVEDVRSSRYCSDLMKMIEAPIIHMNGDDPEAVMKAAQMAMDYRQRFHKDILIDLVCFRRFGHNEADEPRATSPLMYQKVDAHPGTLALYAEQLISKKICTKEELQQWEKEYRDQLDQGAKVVPTQESGGLVEKHESNWSHYLNQPVNTKVETGVSLKVLKELGEKMTQIPEGFQLQRQVDMLVKARKEMTEGKRFMDWGYAETMAYATLLAEGYRIRFSGQDSRRGTFFHRHFTFFEQNTGQEFVPLKHLSSDQAEIDLYDSLLSETAAMGFEYGYASTNPEALVLWEAQFGDFANGAQVIIDQFISAAWQKWQRLAGLVLLLPHGYEGMGPEHSSARLERYLQLCAQENIQVCVPTTPAQIFHLLRRQIHRPVRIPLIVMTPKSLLRHKLAVSSLESLTKSSYQEIIPETEEYSRADKIERVVLCTGKVYYDLLDMRTEMKLETAALIRVEQLYPFSYEQLTEVLKQYKKVKTIVWCQEEPKNQGAWLMTHARIQKCMLETQKLYYAGRKPMAAPAVGNPALHQQQQITLVKEALGVEIKE